MKGEVERRLGISLGITGAVLAAEVAGGVLSGSLALLSDAGHVFTDSFALVLSLLAASISRRPSDPRATFGYHRVGLLAAVINGLSLVAIAALIFMEAYARFLRPTDIALGLMLPVAVGGLAANIAMVVILGGGHHDLNLKSAWLHVLGDTLASVGVIASGVVIYFTGWVYADAVASVAIGAIIVTGGVRVAWEAVRIFLDLAPRHIDVREIAARIMTIQGVRGIHDVHVRSLTHGRVEFTAHVIVEDVRLSEAEAIRREVEHLLSHRGIVHTVIQVEHRACPEDALFCRLPGGDEADGHGHTHGHNH